MVTLVNDPNRTTRAAPNTSAEAEALCKRVAEAVRKALFATKPGDKTGAFHVDAILSKLHIRAYVTAGLVGKKGQPLKNHVWNVVPLKTTFYLDVAPDAVLEKPPAKVLWLVPVEAQKRFGYWIGRQGRAFYEESELDAALVERIVKEVENEHSS